MTIWADGDSLQAELRGLLCRRSKAEAAAAAREGRDARYKVVFVAARAPSLERGPGVELLLVEGGPGAADDRIAALARPGDLAVTRDTPLQERLAALGLAVLNDRGEVLDEGAARERRSARDRAAELRALGLAPESPRRRSWGARELKAFADAFDRELSRALARLPKA
ncbi:MAG TPA: DUF188 domain-containing protein [Spirochaetales bacterium]|nr:DUF188 domain-containing protein [Spirochaetales bacterium]HRY53550.1 DUF188 domain-containing protein [Spirochaetia bacterium]HRZ63371.1 DUF188 domain-containing protein [Spirochaetia bacterium]